ncbi:DUF5009 domain-containing protein [Marinilongibacter aquaticus]|uniref:heparan-alpha-glucosaminide N-acetyltransferase domain-containing protein n=1 Tax=Marinilongibacter aquaticus TaxID=2975157 RepID=UPI0021BD1A0C|nr:DUF5009 domain-containing protein [Marinilongibacter aquaticus]UBM60923.1 DUF5009 domain-containing protein [Marinilongibacter aquaticus]
MKRIASIDVMRGLTLLLMLFVNDLYEPGVPHALVHTQMNEDGMGLADWVFPGFLFLVGMAIPFAHAARVAKGDSEFTILKHVLLRAGSLILIGVFVVNIGGLNPEMTGLGKYFWALLLYLGVFLIWNAYPKDWGLAKWLQLGGWALLLFLAWIYKAGTPEEPLWMRTQWWGILGLIGWGYLAAFLSFSLSKGRMPFLLFFFALFAALNIAGSAGVVHFPEEIGQVFGVILRGNTPFLVMAGVLLGTLVKTWEKGHKMLLYVLLALGLGCLALGFFLRQWFIISKILGTPSWAFICTGISILLFALLYFLVDVLEWGKGFSFFKKAGQNSLTTYLFPDILYFLIWSLDLHLLVYKQEESAWLAVAGSLCWAFAMLAICNRMVKVNIRLKL